MNNLIKLALLFCSLLIGSNISAQSALSSNGLTRNITFKNQCPFPVWVAFTPSYIPGNNAKCTTDKDCKNNAKCVGVAPNKQCVYTIPTMKPNKFDSNGWGLAAYDPAHPSAPGTQTTTQITLELSQPKGTPKPIYQYVANFGARTDCQWVKGADGGKQLICATGQCPVNSTGACVAGMSNPSNHAEITFNKAAVDFYDMSFVNGVNVPIGIAPNNVPAPAKPKPGQAALFWCGKSGFSDARGPFYTGKNVLACQWKFKTPSSPSYNDYSPSVFYTQVTDQNNVQCTSDQGCDKGMRCGFSAQDMAADAVPKCGKPVAYTVPANFCGSPYNQGPKIQKQAFGCYADKDEQAFKMQSYYMCAIPPNAPATIKAPPTCYVGAGKMPSPECCGCIQWSKTIPNLDANSLCKAGDATGGSPNFWQQNVRDKVQWLAEQCLAGYSYQYDDVHSTFVCSSETEPSTTTPNELNYTVTFCPGQQTLF